MDRHLATLLKGLSFPHLYRSTAKTSNLLNTVADPNRQSLHVLPPAQHSVNLPEVIPRRSKDRRARLGGLPNPLYDLRQPATVLPVRQLFTQTGVDNNNNNAQRSAGQQQPPVQTSSNMSSPELRGSPGDPVSDRNPGDRQTGGNPEPANDLPAEDDASAGQSAARNTPSSGRPSGTRGRATHAPGRQRARQTPEYLLERHLEDLDPNRIYDIPGPSQTQSPDGIFRISDLQSVGLLNDSNICGLISIFSAFHRTGLKDHLIDPHFCFTQNRTVDFPSLVFLKIMSAMPSDLPFSLQLFIESWNFSGKTPRIHPGFSDVAALSEGLVTNLQFKQYASRPPVLTEFLGSFKCSRCGRENLCVKRWAMQVQAAIPLLQLPPNNLPADVSDLLAAYVDERFETHCTDLNCNHRILDGKLEVKPGFFTILAINRFDINDPNNKQMNRLTIPSEPVRIGHNLMGDLVSIVCHRGDVNHGHFVSYHQVDRQWFLSDDSRQLSPSQNPLEDGLVDESETIELLFFKNNV